MLGRPPEPGLPPSRCFLWRRLLERAERAPGDPAWVEGEVAGAASLVERVRAAAERLPSEAEIGRLAGYPIALLTGPSGPALLLRFLACRALGLVPCLTPSSPDAEGLALLEASLAAAGRGHPERRPLFYVGHTSGSTGRPRWVPRRPGAWRRSFAAMRRAFGTGRRSLLLLPGSLHFSATLIAALQILAAGGCLALLPRFSPKRLAREAARVEGDPALQGFEPAAFLSPAHLAAWVRSSAAPLPVRRCVTAGDRLPAPVSSELLRRDPSLRLHSYYGASEVGFIAWLRHEDRGTEGEEAGEGDLVGPPFPGVEVALGDERGPTGAGAGRVWVRSPFHPLGSRGWERVDDLAAWTRDGRLRLMGRPGEAIRTGGRSIDPADVERLLERHPAVAHAVACPLPDPLRGARVGAVVTPAPGRKVDTGALLRWARELAPELAPWRVIAVAHVPCTPHGKADRRAAAALFQRAGRVDSSCQF